VSGRRSPFESAGPRSRTNIHQGVPAHPQLAELNGKIRVLLVGKVDSGTNHGTRNTFEAVPAASVSRFVLEMKGGKKYGLLEYSKDICKYRQKAIAKFTAQNGKTYDTEPVIAVQCGKGKKKSGAEKKKGGGEVSAPRAGRRAIG
jgi:hypothetical protein